MSIRSFSVSNKSTGESYESLRERIVKIDYREKQSRKNKSRLTSIPINSSSRKSIIIFNIWSIKFAKFIIIYSPLIKNVERIPIQFTMRKKISCQGISYS